MTWPSGILIWFISLIGSYIIVPFIEFLAWYLVYTIGAIALKTVCKMRYEVFNEDLKYKRTECKNRIVVVTGATSGIGLAAANHFHIKGFVVIACYYSKEEPGYKELDHLTLGVAPDSRSMYLIKLDVKSIESIENCYRQVKAIMDDRPELQLHALVNVAGVGYFHKFQWISRDQIDNMVKTNLLGPILMTRQFLHLLIGNSGSRVVNIASALAYLPVKYNSVYGATKAGLTQFTSSLEADISRYGVKLVMIHPGNVIKNTSILDSSMNSKLEKIMHELNDDEKRIYKTELDQHKQRMDFYERVLKKTTSMKQSSRGTLVSNLERVGEIVSGAVDCTRLDLSESFMRSFDNATRIRDPPRELFAGNNFFNLVIGSALEWISRALLRDAFLNATKIRMNLSHFFA